MVGILLLQAERDGSEGGEMKTPIEWRSPTPEEEAEHDNFLFVDRFDNLIERFYLTGDVKFLKEFILLGGDIHKFDSDLAKTVAGLIGAKPEPNPGGGKDAEMINFYLEVELLRGSLRQKKKNKVAPSITHPRNPTKEKTIQEQLRNLKKVSKDVAIEEVSEKYQRTFDGGEYRYKKGKKLFIEKFKRGWN